MLDVPFLIAVSATETGEEPVEPSAENSAEAGEDGATSGDTAVGEEKNAEGPKGEAGITIGRCIKNY